MMRLMETPDFNESYVYVALILLAVYLLADSAPNRTYSALLLFGVCGYIYFFKKEMKNLEEPRERYTVAANSPTGINRLPAWNQIDHNRLQIENENTWLLYFYYDPEDQKRHGLSVDERGIIKSMYDPNVNPISLSDWRRLERDRAWQRVGALTEEKIRRWFKDHGFRPPQFIPTSREISNDVEESK